ncbi:MAG TPA: hypothetical protein VMY42_14740 [Thermoguttaceae bacterium]|nr:hypothetical protein [Thermoguttaceae bacterium]
MAYISGKTGTILDTSGNPVNPISNWKLTKTSNNPAFATNDSGGSKTRVAGVKDCNGSFDLKLDSVLVVPFDEGDAVTLHLHVDDTGLNYYVVPVIIDSIAVDVDINDGAGITVPIAFSGTGAIVAYGVLISTGGGSGS